MWWIFLVVFAVILAFVLITSFVCFRMCFYVKPEKAEEEGKINLPPDEIYKPYHPIMTKWVLETRSLPMEEVSITSFDGLKLYGKYFECQKGAPMEIMFHGYRGSAERDMCGGVHRAFAQGRNALIVDQRTAGKSEGKVISFGVNEHKDCIEWVNFAINKFGKDVKIIITGISMGASTVLMASGRTLPKNVVGVIADCGYTSAKDIIKKTIREMKLPPALAYPFVKLGARLYGGFNLEEYSPIEAMKECKLPVIFLHGDADEFVPCDMSKRNYDECVSKKKLVLIEGAGHGLAFPKDQEKYLDELWDFFGDCSDM